MRFRALVVVVASLLSSACFATRNDVRILQTDVQTLRMEAARADSMRARQIASLITTRNTTLASLSDSVREASMRLGRFLGDTRQELRVVEEQLLQIQELTGQSQRRLQEMRAAFEARNDQMAVAASAAVPQPGDTTKVAATVTPAAGPGPNQLLIAGSDQFRRGSPGTARALFTELLTTYPTSDLAPEAQLYVAETFAAEGKRAEADSVYQVVLAKYPASPKAADALYKWGLSLETQKKCVEAKAAIERVTRQYPQSDAANLAKDWLSVAGRCKI